MRNKLLKEEYRKLIRNSLSSIEEPCPFCYKKHRVYYLGRKNNSYVNVMVVCDRNNSLYKIKEIHKDLVDSKILPSLEDYIKRERLIIKSKQKELF